MYEALGDLSLDLLRAFEAAARHRSFTAAAMELGTTQPAVSQQIKRLEEQLAIRLMDKKLKATPAMVGTVEQAIGLLPTFARTLRDGLPVPVQAQSISNRAQRLSA